MNLRRTGNLLTLVLHLLLAGAMPWADVIAADQAPVTQCAADEQRGGDCSSRHAHTGCEFCVALRTVSVRATTITFLAAPAMAVQLASSDFHTTPSTAQPDRTLGARAPPAPHA